jgi:membrane protease YdiL (CAAX protease family)
MFFSSIGSIAQAYLEEADGARIEQDADEDSSAFEVNLQVKVVLALQSMGEAGAGQFDSLVDQQFSDAAEYAAGESGVTARIAEAALIFETGEEIPEELLDDLNNSEEDALVDLGVIYSSESLEPDEVAGLVDDLPAGIAGELASAHAYEKAGDSGPSDKLAQPGQYLLFFAGSGAMAFCILAGIPLALLGIWGLVSKRWKGQPSAYYLTDLIDADNYLTKAGLIMVAFLGFSVVLEVVGMTLSIDPLASNAAFTVFGIGAVLAVMTSGKGPKLKKVLLGADHSSAKLVGWGFLGFLGNLPLALLMAVVGQKIFAFLPEPSHPLAEEVSQGGTGVLLGALLVGSILAPFLEEMVFRGAILKSLERVTGRFWLSLVIQAAVFAMIHPQGPALWLSLATIGASAGVLVRQTGALLPAIILHALHNGLLLFVASTLLS